MKHHSRRWPSEQARGALLRLIIVGGLLSPLSTLAACASASHDPNLHPRGSGLAAAALPPPELAAAFDASLREAFDVGPDLSLLLNPALLPRAGGYDTATPVADDLSRALMARALFAGSCAPTRDRARNAPRCDATRAGYAIRVSDAFRMPGDSLRLYLAAERYRSRADSAHYVAPFAFEERYTLVRERGAWIVARKERMMIT
ncbi:MAG: hypothetical protein NVS4B3_06520 [Gemmatimonadaceae bacterium]